MTLTNKMYDVLKKFALVDLPALTSLYFAVASIWNLAHTTEIIGTATAIDTFLGLVLHLSSKGYTAPVDGKILVDTSDPEKDVHTIELGLIPKVGKPYTLAVEAKSTKE
jgi:Putative phage holin Dp-1